ncbi:MAG: EamA family transporter [Pseudomonadota bacterium]
MSATLRGVLWMSGAVLSFCAMAIAARELLTHMGVFEILFFRAGVALLIVLAVALRTGTATLRTRLMGVHLWRNICHLGGQASWVYALGALPLAMVFAIEFTAPIFTAVLAALPGWTAPELRELPWIVAIGIGSFTAHYCLTRSMRFADASVVVPVDFFRLPLIAAVGAVFYSEPFDPAVILGAALIFAGVWFSLAREAGIPR